MSFKIHIEKQIVTIEIALFKGDPKLQSFSEEWQKQNKNLHAIKFDLFNIIKCCTFSKYIQHKLKILQLSSLFASLHGYIIEMVNFHFAQRNEHGKSLKL